MTPHEARGLLAAFAIARDAWLKATIADLPATALWLAGSLGRGEGDEWSDLDLLVVDGELPLRDALLTLESGGRNSLPCGVNPSIRPLTNFDV